jgi:hypothetical protein
MPDLDYLEKQIKWPLWLGCVCRSARSDLRDAEFEEPSVFLAVFHFIQSSMLYSPLLGPGLFFSFVFFFYTDGRTSWTSDQPVARPLPTHRTTQTQNNLTHRHPCLSGIRTYDPSGFYFFGLWDNWHCGHSWPIVPVSGDSEDDCGEQMECRLAGGNRSSRRKPAPAPLLSTTKSHMPRSGFEPRTAAVGSRRLTAWTMARPLRTTFHTYCTTSGWLSRVVFTQYPPLPHQKGIKVFNIKL